MNKILLFATIVAVWMFVSGCCSSEPAQKSEAQMSDTTKQAVSPQPAQPPAIVQNISRVHAVVEAVTLIDNTQYSLTIFVIKSEPVSGKFSLIEPEQRVTIYPEFVYTETGGVVDANNPKNQKLLSLRSAEVGQSLDAKITIDRRGMWRLLEVENR